MSAAPVPPVPPIPSPAVDRGSWNGNVRSRGRLRVQVVVGAQATIAASVEQQSAATVQAEQAMTGATAEAGRMAADLESMVSAG